MAAGPFTNPYVSLRNSRLFRFVDAVVTPLKLLVTAAAVSGVLFGQSGVVRSGNQPVPGATVTATRGDQSITTTTDEAGRYTLAGIPRDDGAWSVEVRMFGFDPVRKEVNFSKSRTADFSMELRAARFARAAGQGASQIESQIESELAAQQHAQAPATGSQDSNEAFLVSGSLSQGLNPNAPPDFRNAPPFPGAGGELSAQASNAPGFGPGPGGSAAGVGPGGPGGFGGGMGGPGGGFGGRGGGSFGGPGGFGMRRPGGPGGRPQGTQFGNRRAPNAIHGMAYMSLNNSALDARPFSITGQEIDQPAYARSRFGVILGGPLAIPKIVNDRSTMFFLNYTGTRARNPYTATQTVPTEAERQGIFAQPISDPETRQPFAGNAIPANRIDPISRQLLDYFPLPNQPGLVNNFVFQTSVAQNTDNFGLRVQRNVTAKDRLAFHVSVQRRDGDTAQPFGFLDTMSGSGLATDVTWTRNLTARTSSSARVTFNRNRNETIPFFAFGPDVASELGIAGTSTNPINYGPPNLNFTNFGALSDASAALMRNQTQGASESIILSRGKHTFTVGGQFTRSNLNTRTDPNGRGTFNFTGLATGFDLADFLLGLPQSSSIRYGDSSTYFRRNVWSGYGQDEWKLNPDLTLNLGLRYEYAAPYTEKYGRMANLDIAPGYTAVAVVTPGAVGPYSGEFPPGLIDPDRNNFAPRIGLAWKVPAGKSSTIVRAGYGIYYNGQAYNSFASRLAQQPPFAVANNVNTSAANVLTLATGFVSTTPEEVTNTFAVDRNYRTPYAQTWNIAIQRELPKGFFVEAGYLGTKGTRLDVLTVPNQGSYTYSSSVGNSIYHALQVRAQQRFRRNISMRAFYTFSKSIDNSSTFGGAGNTVAQNWLDLSAERGLSSFDRRHSFDMNWVLTSPWGGVGSRLAPGGLAALLLRDWQLSGGITVQSGTPLTARVLDSSAQLAQTGGTGSKRADATGQSLSTGSGFFNLAAFSVPPPGVLGNAGRNTIPGPGLFSVNAAFGRSFQLDESRRRLELRLEANNVFNNVSYTNINTVVNATNYGLPVSASSMRSVNLVMRFRF